MAMDVRIADNISLGSYCKIDRISELAVFKIIVQQVGVVTTVVTLFGGSKDLAGSMDVLSCNHHTRNLSDVNIGMWCTSLIVAFIFFCLIVRRIDDISAETTHNNRLPAIVQVFLWCPSVAPTLYCCLRDGALYFVLIFSVLSFNLVLTATQTSYALIGTPWLIAIYAIASTRIFLNLRELCNSPQRFAGATWSEFQEASAVEFRILESAGTLVEP
ncbi:hypothetical protein VKT23_007491 [Stygiomarasmius scandens]|uniref:Uncharacterized protein n=1 Tax=Marasmiellus scandens TaxID=2682957 RepID=A0ABR1JK11_9AGAR